MRLVLTLLLIIAGLEARDLQNRPLPHDLGQVIRASASTDQSLRPEACVMRIEPDSNDNRTRAHDV